MKNWILFTLVALSFGVSLVSAGGLLRNIFQVGWEAPTEYGKKTEEILPTLFKESHEHTWIKKPVYNVETSKSYEHARQKVLHKHVTHQKVIHEQNHHQNILKEHHQHNVITHNIHNQINNVHENILHRENIIKPVLVQHEHHEHKVTNAKEVQHTESHKEKHLHEEHVTNVKAEPIVKKPWSFSGWLTAWGK